MIVFKNYFKILKKHLGLVILYVAMLFIFSAFSTTSNNTTTSFVASKPSIAIINEDGKTKINDNFMKYIKNHAKIKKIDNVDDALFYQNVDAVVYIYKGYTNDYLNNKEKNLKVKYTFGDTAIYSNMILQKYFKAADISNDNFKDEDLVIDTINSSLKNSTKVEIKNKLDTTKLSKANFFFSYANYSILSICIYVIALLMSIFNKKDVRKRNSVSSKKNSSIMKELYLGNFTFAFMTWIMLMLISFIVVGNTMFSLNGLFFILNSLIFIFCALSIGFLAGNIFNNQAAIGAIVNIVGLGTSFTCGCFIPLQFLPDSVVNVSRFLPSYWYIHNNDLIGKIEVFNKTNVNNLLFNMLIVFIYAIFFFMISIYISNKKRKSN